MLCPAPAGVCERDQLPEAVLTQRCGEVIDESFEHDPSLLPRPVRARRHQRNPTVQGRDVASRRSLMGCESLKVIGHSDGLPMVLSRFALAAQTRLTVTTAHALDDIAAAWGAAQEQCHRDNSMLRDSSGIRLVRAGCGMTPVRRAVWRLSRDKSFSGRTGCRG
jgi:hypothetical protein